jgi:hypothetical protein
MVNVDGEKVISGEGMPIKGTGRRGDLVIEFHVHGWLRRRIITPVSTCHVHSLGIHVSGRGGASPPSWNVGCALKQWW